MRPTAGLGPTRGPLPGGPFLCGRGLPLEQAVQVRWNGHMVPYIEAETDRDLAFTLGMVHAHLREALQTALTMAEQTITTLRRVREAMA